MARPFIDETGNRYGILTVVARVEGKWLCRCDCGNLKLITRENLLSGRQISCGCYRADKASRRMAARTPDETGKRYGKLLVLERDGLDGRNAAWRCRCDCGNEVRARATRLRSRETVSCGCWVPTKERKDHNGNDHHNWKGEEVGYHALHIWLAKHKTKTGICSRCNAERYTEWANIAPGRPRSRNLDDYVEVCKPCHMELDDHPWLRAKLKESA